MQGPKGHVSDAASVNSSLLNFIHDGVDVIQQDLAECPGLALNVSRHVVVLECLTRGAGFLVALRRLGALEPS